MKRRRILRDIPEAEQTESDKKALRALDRLSKNSSLGDRVRQDGLTIHFIRNGDGYYTTHMMPQRKDLPFDMANLDYINYPEYPKHFKKHGRSGIPFTTCQCCQSNDPSGFMLLNTLWHQIAPDPRGIMCLECVRYKLGPLHQEMFDMRIPLNAVNVGDLPTKEQAHNPLGQAET